MFEHSCPRSDQVIRIVAIAWPETVIHLRNRSIDDARCQEVVSYFALRRCALSAGFSYHSTSTRTSANTIDILPGEFGAGACSMHWLNVNRALPIDATLRA